jgi:hypothetical protein
VAGTVRPSAFAALRLITNSNLVGWKIGNLARFHTFQNLVSHVGDAIAEGRNFDPIGHQASGFDEHF